MFAPKDLCASSCSPRIMLRIFPSFISDLHFEAVNQTRVAPSHEFRSS